MALSTPMNSSVTQQEGQTLKELEQWGQQRKTELEHLKALATDHSVQPTEVARQQEVSLADVNGSKASLSFKLHPKGKRIFHL